MRLEIAERLRCPRPHAPTPLVIVAERVVDRELVTGIAGCSVCALEARVSGGSVFFPDAVAGRAPLMDVDGVAAVASKEPAGAVGRHAPAERDAVDRLVALLLLGEPGGALLLAGRYARLAHLIAARVGISIVVFGASRASAAVDVVNAVGESPGVVSEVHLAEPVIPFGDGTFRAAAFDASFGEGTILDAVRSVLTQGRIVGPADLTMPSGVRELARDADEWVGEREAGTPCVVPLRRA